MRLAVCYLFQTHDNEERKPIGFGHDRRTTPTKLLSIGTRVFRSCLGVEDVATVFNV